jgi:hypothetical protein
MEKTKQNYQIQKGMSFNQMSGGANRSASPAIVK